MPNQPTEWKWQVTPMAVGTQKLYLTLYAVVHAEDGEHTIKRKTFDEEIVVNVSLGQRVGEFTQENWKWLWTTILVPAWGGGVTARKKSKGSKKADAST